MVSDRSQVDFAVGGNSFECFMAAVDCFSAVELAREC